MAQLQLFLNDLDTDLVAALQRYSMKKNISVEAAVTRLLESVFFGVAHYSGISIEDLKPMGYIIMIDEAVDKVKKPYRCPTCGNTAFYYYGGVKLVMNGIYDQDGNMSDGEEVDWFKTVGVPTPIPCSGKLRAKLPNGELKQVRCKTTLFKVGA